MKAFCTHLLILICFSSIPSISFSQSRQKADSVATLIQAGINAKDNPALYALMGKTYQAKNTAKYLADFYNTNIFPAGNAKVPEYIGAIGRVSHYKLVFSTEVLELSIALDADNKLQLLQFQPFIPKKTILAATSNPLATVFDKRVDSAARQYIQKANTVGLSIGIFNKGNTLTYGYGETIRNNSLVPNANTIFEIGSITKTFTATLLAHYVLNGKVKLSDPITKYLPDSVASNKNLQNITLQELSNHTAGFPKLPESFFSQPNYIAANPYKNYGECELFAYLKNCTLQSVPGEKFDYSNIGVGLLGKILQNISGKTFGQMVSEIITKPLGMASTEQQVGPELTPRYASVYNQDGTLVPHWDFNALAACGALHSTITDLLVYVRANTHPANTPLSKAIELTHQLTFSKTNKIGLGWIIIKVNQSEYYFHDGGTAGSSSFLAFNPDKDIAVVVLSNAAESTYDLGTSLVKFLN